MYVFRALFVVNVEVKVAEKEDKEKIQAILDTRFLVQRSKSDIYLLVAFRPVTNCRSWSLVRISKVGVFDKWVFKNRPQSGLRALFHLFGLSPFEN